MFFLMIRGPPKSTRTDTLFPSTTLFRAARLEEAQALQAHLRAVDRDLRIPRALELAHLAAHDLVGGARVALEHDATHVDARARHHLDRKSTSLNSSH